MRVSRQYKSCASAGLFLWAGPLTFTVDQSLTDKALRRTWFCGRHRCWRWPRVLPHQWDRFQRDRVTGGRCSGMTASEAPTAGSRRARVNVLQNPDQDWIVFLGTATSEGVPRVSCLTEQPAPRCRVCVDAMAHPLSPNRRRNTSIVVRRRRRSFAGREALNGRSHENVVIDVGKFFYQSAIDVFPAVGLRQIDAVVLTHEHADATNGLDDLRDWTLNIGRRHGDGPLCIPVWGDAATLERVTNAFPYLVEPSRATGSGLVPKLSFHRIEAYEEFCPSHPRPASTGNCLEIGASLYPLESDRLRLLPIPVAHGRDQGCLAFRFGDVVYMSDVSSIPPKAMDAIRGCRVLIVDALHPGAGSHVSHFCEQQALELVLALRPEHTFFTGMTHMWDHDRDNERLAAWAAAESRHAGGRPLHVELAHDGLCVPVNL